MRASHRELRAALHDLEDTGPPVTRRLGNPGRGAFAALPKPRSRYDAVELALERPGERLTLGGAYVLSRKYGNYPGVYDQDFGNPNAHTGAPLFNHLGPLPNDRTHVIKLRVAFAPSSRLTLGALGIAQSGTPLTVIGQTSPDPISAYFISERGTAGRTPFTWDGDLRASWRLSSRRDVDARAVVDILHVFNARRPLVLSQVKYFGVDSLNNPINPNPFYGQGTRFQPPIALRVGFEAGRRGRASEAP